MRLVVLVSDDIEVLTVNCPKIRSIEVCLVEDIRVNGVFFHELSVGIVALEMHCKINVIGLEMDPALCMISAQRFVEIVGSFKALKNLEIHTIWEEEMGVPLISLLQGLPHLERLIIISMFLLVSNSF